MMKVNYNMIYKTLPLDNVTSLVGSRKAPTSRMRSMFLLVIFLVPFYLIYLNYTTKFSHINSALNTITNQYKGINENSSQQYLNSNMMKESFTIKTEGCTIPGMTPFDEGINKFTTPLNETEIKKWECDNMHNPLIKRNRTHIWIVEANKPFYNIADDNTFTCCLRPFYRPNFIPNIWDPDIDNRAKYESCIDFQKSIKVLHEFIKVTCYSEEQEIYRNLFLFTPKKKVMLYDDDIEISQNKTVYNVIILGLDTISRLNFHRTMPKTLNFLLNKGAVELLGYNKVAYDSYLNLVPMLMGYSGEELKKICYIHKHANFDFCPFIWTWYKRAGFYTAIAEDASVRGTFNYQRDGFIKTPTDYYSRTFTYQVEKTLPHTEKNRTRVSFCVGDQYFYKVLLDYVENILWTISPSKLFGFFWEMAISHDFLTTPTIMDDGYLDFFLRLDKSNFLNKTIILLVSDHGMRWGPIRSTTQGRFEERLPFVYVLTPPAFQSTYQLAFNNLKTNVERLTTPYDVHETLVDLINLENIQNEKIALRREENYSNNRGISLFLPIPGNRTCSLAGIPLEWCTCVKSHKVSKTKEVKEAAGIIVKHMNGLLVGSPQCSWLVLDEVVDVSGLVSGTSDQSGDATPEFLVVVQTQPGGGLFEGFVRYRHQQWNVIGVVNRINSIAGKDWCIKNPLLSLYCYCKSV